MVLHRKSESIAGKPAIRSERAVRWSERPIGGSKGQLEGLGGQRDGQGAVRGFERPIDILLQKKEGEKAKKNEKEKGKRKDK